MKNNKSISKIQNLKNFEFLIILLFAQEFQELDKLKKKMKAIKKYILIAGLILALKFLIPSLIHRSESITNIIVSL